MSRNSRSSVLSEKPMNIIEIKAAMSKLNDLMDSDDLDVSQEELDRS